MRLRPDIARWLLAAAAVGVGTMLVSLDHRLTAQAMRLEQQLVRGEQQTARLEAALRKLEEIAPALIPTQESVGTARHRPSAFAPPPQRLRSPAAPSPAVVPQFRPSPAPGKAREQPQGSNLHAPQRGPALAAIFERESGRSDWGTRTAAQIARAYEAEPFFAGLDGSLKTDCRVTTCLMTWSVPYVDPNDSALAMAKFELMALAAQKEPPVRRMHGVRHTEQGRTVIDVYLSSR